MTHPHLRLWLEAPEKRVFRVDILQMCPTIFAGVRLFHPATVAVRNKLRTIANAQHGEFSDKLTEVYLEGFRVMDRKGRTTEDDTNDGRVILWKLVVGQNLAEGIEFAHPSPDELGGL